MVSSALITLGLLAGVANGLVPPQRQVMRRVVVGAQVLRSGERGVAVLTGGLPKKQAKKQRRSRTPLLFPVIHEATGRSGWLRLRPEQGYLAKQPNSTRIECAVRGDSGEELVLTPRGVLLAPPVTPVPEFDEDDMLVRRSTVKQLSSLKVGDALKGKVLSLTRNGGALLSIAGVYRLAASGKGRVKARLINPEGRLPAVGTTVDCYVRFAEVNSGRLAVSLEKLTGEEIRRERIVTRLKRQIKRGTLRLGGQRVGTVVKLEETVATVHAGGLVGTVELGSRVVELHDTLSVKITSLSKEEPGKAEFDLIPLDESPQ